MFTDNYTLSRLCLPTTTYLADYIDQQLHT